MHHVCALAVLLATTPLARDNRFDPLIAAAIGQTRVVHAVPPALVRAVIRQESGFSPRALSRAGARGLMQLMPATAQRLGVAPEALWDPAKNILAGVRLLAVLLEHYRGDIVSALVAYNARPRRLLAPIPQNGETPRYVWNVLAFYEQYRREERGALVGPASVGDPDGLLPFEPSELDHPEQSRSPEAATGTTTANWSQSCPR
jgi:soluble lytic murein transglycosylase-like protein